MAFIEEISTCAPGVGGEGEVVSVGAIVSAGAGAGAGAGSGRSVDKRRNIGLSKLYIALRLARLEGIATTVSHGGSSTTNCVFIS